MEKIIYGVYSSPFGEMGIGSNSQGIYWIGFGDCCYYEMDRRFIGCDLKKTCVNDLGDEIIKSWEQGKVPNLSLDLHGTKFQKSVWRALLEVNKGEVKSYSDIANMIGKPKAVRAVASAIAKNPVSLIIPCHRIIPKAGGIGNYAWGQDIKRNILLAEAL